MPPRSVSLCAAAVLAGLAFRQDPSSDLELTVTEGTNIAAIASPDRKSIAIDLQGGLWILQLGGGEAKKITPDAVEARQPTWAPDSRSIAFQGYDDNAWHIYRIGVDGTGLTALTDGLFDDREPDWSRDGARIVFASDRYGGIYSAWTVDVASRAVAQVSTYEARMPCWARSDHEIIFQGANPRDAKKTLAWWIARPGGPVRPALADARSPDAQAPPTCGSGRAHGLEAAIASSGESDVFPFLPQWISPTELLYTADGHVKRRAGLNGKPTVVPFRAGLKVRPPIYPRRHRDLQPGHRQPALGIVELGEECAVHADAALVCRIHVVAP